MQLVHISLPLVSTTSFYYTHFQALQPVVDWALDTEKSV